MQAITTKYLPATNTHGSRIKASCERGSVTIDYPHHCRHGDECHREAVFALIRKFVEADEKTGTKPADNPWNRPFVTGGTKHEYVHVFSGWHNAAIVQFSDADDLVNFLRYVEKARTTEGTVSGLVHGIACSALRRSKATAI